MKGRGAWRVGVPCDATAHLVTMPKVLWKWRAHRGHRRGFDRTTQAANVVFGKNFHHHDALTVKVVFSHIAKATARHDHLHRDREPRLNAVVWHQTKHIPELTHRCR